MQPTIKNKQIGIIILLISIVLAFLLVSYNTQFQIYHQQTCPVIQSGEVCPFKNNLPQPIVAGILIDAVLFLLGTYLILVDTSKKPHKLKISLKNLDEDETKIYKLLVDSDGSVFQGDLIKKTGFSKVKVSRIIDRLEVKDIVIRRRRGMSNIVVIK